jgi:hypothetical protein
VNSQKMVDLLLRIIGVNSPEDIAERFFRVSIVILVCGLVKERPVLIILESISVVAVVSVVAVCLRRLEVR